MPNWFLPARAREALARPMDSAALEKKAMSAPLIALSLARRASWGERSYAALAREGVMQNAIAYRCVRMIAEAAASVPWLLYDGASELEDHPLLTLLAKPNTNDDGRALFERWYAYLQCSGNSYLEALSAGGVVRELYTLRPDRVRAVPGPRGWPAAYTYTVGNQTTTIAPDRDTGFMPLLHATLFHPLDDTYGFSPIEAAARAIDIHNAGGAWTKALLDNAARPSGALVYKGPDGAPNLTGDQFERRGWGGSMDSASRISRTSNPARRARVCRRWIRPSAPAMA